MSACRTARCALATAAALACAACGVLAPLPAETTLEDRLAAFPTAGLPLDAPVTIRWDAHQIPFIKAETDGDAAFALGMVHAHLRLGQMALVRRIVQGRISESAGPFTTDIDAAIRAVDFYGAAEEILSAMPPESRRWTERYAAGVNAYAARVGPDWRPHEFDVAAIEWEPWTPEDAIALGRAGGIDLNWEYLLAVLSIEDPDLRARVAGRILADGQTGAISYDSASADRALGPLATLRRAAAAAGRLGRTGSNSIVIAPGRSATGAALIANDPHLAFLIPNPWLIAGLRTPDTAIVGMMVPGTPVFAFGRTEHVTWGGTNLRATTSQLIDVSGLPEADFDTEILRIGVRAWPDRTVEIRRTEFGPVVSDLDIAGGTGAAFALRWTGNTPSDEITALLGAMRAESVEAFAEAMAGFAFPPQTFLAADSAGRIASFVALKVPARAPGSGYPPLVARAQSARDWRGFTTGADLPMVIDPSQGFIASANNRPFAEGDRPYGGVFPQDERIRRLQSLLARDDSVSIEDLAAIQQDVVSPLSLELRDALRPRLEAHREAGDGAAAISLIVGWNGAYDVESRGAAVFESFLTAFAPAVYFALGRRAEHEVYEALGRGRSFLIEDMAGLSDRDWARALDIGLRRAALTASAGTRWGDLHRLAVGHVFQNAPLLGRRYLIERVPVPGSRETVLKSAHPSTDEPHDSFFGSQSRHISDLADPDANHFVLLGGQDGWIGSTTFADQVPLWREGRFVAVPLRPESVRKAFPRSVLLMP